MHERPGGFVSHAALGDINGDGLGDYMLSANIYTGGDFAFQYRLYWPPAIDGVGVVDFGATGTTGLDDVDGDGIPDIAVGAPGDLTYYSGGRGFVFVFSGASGDLLYWLKSPEEPRDMYTSDFYGYRVRNPGDVNGDGLGDLAVLAPELQSVLVYDGPTGELLYRIGPQSMSWEFLPAGDLNGNGFDDLLLNVNVPGARSVRAIEGRDGSHLFDMPPHLWGLDGCSLRGPENGSSIGSEGQDWDGDGFPDFVIGVAPPGMRLISSAPIGVTSLGAPCPSPGELRIGCTGSPEAGRALPVHLSKAPPDRQALLLVGGSLEDHPPATRCRSRGASSCTTHVGSLRAVRFARTARIRPGEGAATVELALPRMLSALGSVAYVQWAVREPSVPCGWAFTRVLRLEIQPGTAGQPVVRAQGVELRDR